MTGKKKIILTHDSDHPDAKGSPGDVITCDAEIAERFIEGRGAQEYKPKADDNKALAGK